MLFDRGVPLIGADATPLPLPRGLGGLGSGISTPLTPPTPPTLLTDVLGTLAVCTPVTLCRLLLVTPLLLCELFVLFGIKLVS